MHLIQIGDIFVVVTINMDDKLFLNNLFKNAPWACSVEIVQTEMQYMAYTIPYSVSVLAQKYFPLDLKNPTLTSRSSKHWSQPYFCLDFTAAFSLV